MAEAFQNKLGSGKLTAESAGIEPGSLNPIVIEAMLEAGLDISKNTCDSVERFIPRSEEFDYVITVCDETSAERCPTFPGATKRLHWGFSDPSSLHGSAEERLSRTREIRNAIKKKVRNFLDNLVDE